MNIKAKVTRKLVSHFTNRPGNVVPIMIIFAILGALLLVRSFAAPNDNISVEVETGTVSGAAQVGQDSTASQNNFVRVKVSAPTGNLPAAPKIMPIGDSITHGISIGEGMLSYRMRLQDKLRASGCEYDLVGPRNTLAGGEFVGGYDNDHNGEGGRTTVHFMGDLQGHANQYRPDIALIMIGHNDVYGRWMLEGNDRESVMTSTANNLGEMIDMLRNANPNIFIYVARVIPSVVVNNSDFDDLNNRYAGVVSQRAATGARVSMVDTATGYLVSDNADGVHPGHSGDEKIATRWFDALKPLLDANNICN